MRKVILYLFSILCFSGILFAEGYADDDRMILSKAEYLSCGISYIPSGTGQRGFLTERIWNDIPCECVLTDPEEIQSALVSGNSENAFGFIRNAAEKENVLYAGTFMDSEGPSEQFQFLTEINGFRITPAEKCTFYPSPDRLVSGDLIFWMNRDGTCANVGIVCEHHSDRVTAVVHSADAESVWIEINENNLMKIGDFLVVHPDYAYNEQLIYLYCVNTLHYTRTGACGILANVHCESSSVSDREETDSGIGYGICQWSFERREQFEQYCHENGLDRTALETQMEFMGYELENDFKFTGDFLRSVQNNENGAYDAGYWVCFEYEMPGNFEMISDERGKLSLEIWRQMG